MPIAASLLEENDMTQRPAKRVLLVGWDAADWKLIQSLLEAGKMPVLEGLIERGVSGRISTLQPIVSPVLWNSIATGKHADKHGILGFVEPSPDGNGVRPVSSTSRRAKALWNILSQHGYRSCVVGWYASHPAEPINGCILSDRFQTTVENASTVRALDPAAVHPPELLELAEELRVSPAELTAEQLRPFFAHELPDTTKDIRPHLMAKLLAECASIHNAATYFAEHEQWDLLAVYYDAIDHFGHGFMEYHPPAMAHVSTQDAAIYGHVMEAVYRFHDLMLGRLLELAGPDTTVLLLSDHGFYHDQQRPALERDAEKPREKTGAGLNPLAWHRPHGIFVAAGPGIKKDELVHGASLLDVAPTVLALLGVPVGADMDGRPLATIFSEQIEIQSVPSHEPPHPNDGVHRSASAEESDPWAARQALEQLAALGYIELPDPKHPGESAKLAEIARKNNLAQVYYSTRRPELALPLLEELQREEDLPHVRCRIALCLLALERAAEAEPILTDVLDRYPEMTLAPLLLAQVKLALGDANAAAALLARVQEAETRLPYFHVVAGQIHLRQRKWKEAEAAFRAALATDDDSAEAHDGLGVALRMTGRLDEALHEHMRSVSLLHDRPQTHVNLGVSLALAKQFDWAIRAFTIASEMAPDEPFPHRCLAQLYRRGKKDEAKSRVHMEKASELRKKLRGARPAYIAGA
ncbi:MAG TPA: alkaline phosphatase family protein [Chthoniobacterales bacterium]|nr:alkaline phosphatase family protein [Chthoniobacterales bacterium]